jgi:hypothetical protein
MTAYSVSSIGSTPVCATANPMMKKIASESVKRGSVSSPLRLPHFQP